MNSIKCKINNGEWYNYPNLYHIFSTAEDKDKKCVEIVKNKVKNFLITNPVDLGAGTGKMYEQLISELNYKGKLFCVENNINMINYLTQKYKNNKEVNILKSDIESFDLGNYKSNFIISSFGFPSKLFDKEKTMRELKNIYKNLSNDGIFITIGWNEKWNDELSDIWRKYSKTKFDDKIVDARNCALSWLANNIETTLKFDNISERNKIFNYLFDHLESNNKLEFKMYMGVTFNTKEEIRKIIENMDGEFYERN